MSDLLTWTDYERPKGLPRLSFSSAGKDRKMVEREWNGALCKRGMAD